MSDYKCIFFFDKDLCHIALIVIDFDVSVTDRPQSPNESRRSDLHAHTYLQSVTSTPPTTRCIHTNNI